MHEFVNKSVSDMIGKYEHIKTFIVNLENARNNGIRLLHCARSLELDIVRK